MARAFWITGPRQGELRDEPLARPTAGDALVETAYSAISRGTEALVFDARVPESEYQRMRAPFQDGAFPAPVKYGYASVGRVIAGPDELVGRDVFCLYPHQTAYVVSADSLHVIPDGVPRERAVLAANLETAVNAIWDAAPAVGDRISVVGAGAVGCLTAWLATGIRGCDVELIDIDDGKREIARELGAGFALPDRATPNADLVIHASGTSAGLNTALALAGFEATVLELSWFGEGSTAAALGGRFHSQRLRLQASQVGAIASRQRARWDRARRMALVMALLRDATLDALISGESPFDELPRTMARLAESASGALCHRITYL